MSLKYPLSDILKYFESIFGVEVMEVSVFS